MGQSQKQKKWQSQAIDYAFEYGWKVLPIYPGGLTEEEKEAANDVRAQLGYTLVNGHEEGTSEVAEIKEWTGMPKALIGARTGSESNLMALEVPTGEDSPLSNSKRRKLEEKLPDTRVVQDFRRRNYFLFRCAEHPGFDGLRRSDGLILHGEGSVVPLPGPPWRRRRRITWLLNSEEPDEGDELPALPAWVKSLFGVNKGLDAALSDEGGEEKKNEARDESQLPVKRESESPSPQRKHTSLPFQSGDDLRISASAKESLPFSWLENGALSVLTGPPKTSGKSTFAANLAAHVASGRLFLGKELTSRPVVFLSDLPSARLRTIISGIGLEREALSRLQVLHPNDVTHADWRSLLGSVFDHAAEEEAALLIIDSLDQFVEAKGGLDPTISDEVNFMLTAKLPKECATLAVKACPVGTAEPMSETIERLGLLGTNADLVARLDAPPTNSSYPTLRRLQFRGRLGDTPSHLLCEMIRDRYQMLEMGSIRGARSFERVTVNGPQSPERGDGRKRKADNIQLEASDRQAKLGFPSENSTNGSAE